MVDREDNMGRLQEFPQTRGFSTTFLNDEVTRKLYVMLELRAESTSHSSCVASLCLGEEGEVHRDISINSHVCIVPHRRVLSCHSSSFSM